MDFFAQEQAKGLVSQTESNGLAWCMLIVDDDPEVHAVTRLALRNFQFEDRDIDIISAYSGEEAKLIFEQRNDISLALVDVVMETENAGLDLVRHLRVEQGNHKVRLVLRTGQAGQAPEERVVREYDIDDYREKTDLTKQRLRTLLYSMLRSYRDIDVIQTQRDRLQSVIESCAKVRDTISLKHFASIALQQMIIIQHFNDSQIYYIEVPSQDRIVQKTKILITTEDIISFEKDGAVDMLPADVAERFDVALSLKASKSYPDAYVFYSQASGGGSNVIYISYHAALSELDQQLLEIYVQNLAITFGNICLQNDLQDASKELILTLTDTVEARSNETGAHIQRVALVSERLAQLSGLSEYETTLIKLASPLHDIGKIAIPDAILHKPGKLDPDEWEIMKKHVDYGVAILERSKSELMIVATQIAGTHHERWDGTGYPNMLKGYEIPIAGRITTLADVFDGLGSKRSYKEAWSPEAILCYVLAEREKLFDPNLVDLFVAHYDEFIDIRNQHPDTYPYKH